jgi:hypothetical protein
MSTTTENRYEAIANRSRSRRIRDMAFAVLIAAVAAFSLGSLRAAADNVAHAPTAATAPQTAGSCSLQPTC